MPFGIGDMEAAKALQSGFKRTGTFHGDTGGGNTGGRNHPGRNMASSRHAGPAPTPFPSDPPTRYGTNQPTSAFTRTQRATPTQSVTRPEPVAKYEPVIEFWGDEKPTQVTESRKKDEVHHGGPAPNGGQNAGKPTETSLRFTARPLADITNDNMHVGPLKQAPTQSNGDQGLSMSQLNGGHASRTTVAASAPAPQAPSHAGGGITEANLRALNESNKNRDNVNTLTHPAIIVSEPANAAHELARGHDSDVEMTVPTGYSTSIEVSNIQVVVAPTDGGHGSVGVIDEKIKAKASSYFGLDFGKLGQATDDHGKDTQVLGTHAMDGQVTDSLKSGVQETIGQTPVQTTSAAVKPVAPQHASTKDHIKKVIDINQEGRRAIWYYQEDDSEPQPLPPAPVQDIEEEVDLMKPMPRFTRPCYKDNTTFRRDSLGASTLSPINTGRRSVTLSSVHAPPQMCTCHCPVHGGHASMSGH